MVWVTAIPMFLVLQNLVAVVVLLVITALLQEALLFLVQEEVLEELHMHKILPQAVNGLIGEPLLVMGVEQQELIEDMVVGMEEMVALDLTMSEALVVRQVAVEEPVLLLLEQIVGM